MYPKPKDLIIRNNGSKTFKLIILFILFAGNAFAQTTGKLAGRVTDENGEGLPGANVLIEGTNLGAATDFDGYYVILNIRAGTYDVQFRYIGYQSKKVQGVNINSDKTTQLDITLNSEVIQSEEVIVTAEI